MDNSILSQSSCWSCRDHAQTIISDGNSYPKCTKVFHITSTTGLMLPQKLQRVLLVPWGLMLYSDNRAWYFIDGKFLDNFKDKRRKGTDEQKGFNTLLPTLQRKRNKARKTIITIFIPQGNREKSKNGFALFYFIYSFIFHMFTIVVVSVYLLESSFFYLGQTLCHLHTPQL